MSPLKKKTDYFLSSAAALLAFLDSIINNMFLFWCVIHILLNVTAYTVMWHLAYFTWKKTNLAEWLLHWSQDFNSALFMLILPYSELSRETEGVFFSH